MGHVCNEIGETGHLEDRYTQKRGVWVFEIFPKTGEWGTCRSNFSHKKGEVGKIGGYFRIEDTLSLTLSSLVCFAYLHHI